MHTHTYHQSAWSGPLRPRMVRWFVLSCGLFLSWELSTATPGNSPQDSKWSLRASTELSWSLFLTWTSRCFVTLPLPSHSLIRFNRYTVLANVDLSLLWMPPSDESFIAVLHTVVQSEQVWRTWAQISGSTHSHGGGTCGWDLAGDYCMKTVLRYSIRSANMGCILLCARHWAKDWAYRNEQGAHRLVGKTNMHTDSRYVSPRFLWEHIPKPGS